MLAYVITGIIILLVIINYVLGIKLYEEPADQNYFDNVTTLNLGSTKNIAADPRHIAFLSIITGVLLGLYTAYISSLNVSGWLFVFTVILLFVFYLTELTRRITLRDGKLSLKKLFFFEKVVDARDIKGMFIYSYNKKFLKTHTYTTKLVIRTNNLKTIKFTLSSIDNRAVLNLMKEVFGISSYKMFISK